MTQPDVAELNYEQAREELTQVVRTLESGATTLEESMALWERGEALASRCQEWLDGARDRLAAVRDADERGEQEGDGDRPEQSGRPAGAEQGAERSAPARGASAGAGEQ